MYKAIKIKVLQISPKAIEMKGKIAKHRQSKLASKCKESL
jgi:hypothetical protein